MENLTFRMFSPMLKDYEDGDPFRATPSMNSRWSSNSYKITKKIGKRTRKSSHLRTYENLIKT